MFYFELFLKLIVSFFSVLVFSKLLGKRNISPTSPSDHINNYVLGGLVGGVIYNSEIGVFDVILVFVLWGSFIKILDFIKTWVKKIRKIIDGEPILLYYNDNFIITNLKKSNLSVADFYYSMRMKGIQTISNISKAELLPNGQIVFIESKVDELNYLVISDGKFNKNEVELAGLKEEFILNDIGIQDVKEISSCEYTNGTYRYTKYWLLYVQSVWHVL